MNNYSYLLAIYPTMKFVVIARGVYGSVVGGEGIIWWIIDG